MHDLTCHDQVLVVLSPSPKGLSSLSSVLIMHYSQIMKFFWTAYSTCIHCLLQIYSIADIKKCGRQYSVMISVSICEVGHPGLSQTQSISERCKFTSMLSICTTSASDWFNKGKTMCYRVCDKACKRISNYMSTSISPVDCKPTNITILR